MAGAILCLSFSAAFHLLYIYNEKVHKLSSRLDYGGISLMIAGSTFPAVMYGFACNTTARVVILGIVSVAAVAAFFVTLAPGGDTSAFRTVRGVLFFITGVFAAIPILVATASTGSIYYWAIGHGLYAISGFFYLTRIPERYAPGKFDYLVLPR